MLIDALAAMVVLDPGRFDVIVASNLFGDILSGPAAAVAGSIGIAPSGNLNPEREIANPIGAIWSGAQMLEHLGETGRLPDACNTLQTRGRSSVVLCRATTISASP